MTTQDLKAIRFRALHQGTGAFVIANAWDGGSARILAGLGFQALATSSGGQAGTLGKRDGNVTREEALAHCRAIVAATDLPVSADLEKGFGDAPEMTAETIRLAAGIGLVGASIEDATGDRDKPLYDMSHAIERVAAAVQAARALPFPFTLTARAEGFLRGSTHLPTLSPTGTNHLGLQEPSHHKCHEDDQADTSRSAEHRHLPNFEQFRKRKLGADRKHQEDDANIGKCLEGVRVGHPRPGCEGADHHPAEDVPDDEWLTQKEGHHPTTESGEEEEAKIPKQLRVGPPARRRPSGEAAGTLRRPREAE